MASSSDPGKDPNKSEPKPDNPFIKFRQFADQQIGSLLQGIVGLPSALSGKPENTRWAVFDEDLRRRDEQQARKQELKDSEARRLAQTTFEEAGTAKKSLDRKDDSQVEKSLVPGIFRRWREDVSNAGQDNDGTRDLPLYSPVTKTLFAHLHQPEDGTKDWKARDLEADVDILLEILPALWKSQQSSNTLRTTQYLIYNQLNRSSTLRSDYSLLPYLMFSPYSPIRLTEDKSTSPDRLQGTFPYCHAFEDLLRTTRPPPKTSLVSVLFGNFLPVHAVLNLQRSIDVPISKAATYHTWILGLQRAGVLQESERISEQRALSGFSSIKSPGLASATSNLSNPNAKPVHKEAQTELDMYEYFLRWASKDGGIKELVKATLTQAGDDEWDALDSYIAAAYSPRLPEGAAAELREGKAKYREAGRTKRQAEQHFQALEAPETKSAAEGQDKVVSERTVTQQIKQADGTVETHVSVWKKFADGRETTTTTSHTEEPERDEDDFKPLSIAEEAKVLSEKKRTAKETTEKKKGWFWN